MIDRRCRRVTRVDTVDGFAGVLVLSFLRMARVAAVVTDHAVIPVVTLTRVTQLRMSRALIDRMAELRVELARIHFVGMARVAVHADGAVVRFGRRMTAVSTGRASKCQHCQDGQYE